jgi:hypothetical protein
MLDTISNINGRGSRIQPEPKTVNGRGLKRRRLSRYQRAHWAADCVTGTVSLRPSIEQACLLFDVPRALVRKYLKARNGHNGKHRNGYAETLADHITRCSPAERLEAGRKVGVGVIWDTMIIPALVEERAASENPTTA